ncbi:hypothetical protein AVEN_107331-1 [Araneus ventricosus]|uniref:Saccharopine dehydrogenase NADP binding domain-containing protein n=1 Tax=Araneus ventricosus TaxID=182803 RepID=A0A4Y2S5S4_ARAVE|nr:hypothetical protein AVEN_107331-1 [Araneus ventricosus]
MMSKDCGEFDLVIFGASGLTGRYAVEELARSVVRFPEIRWAVAGRNAEKLKETLAIVQEYLLDATESETLRAFAHGQGGVIFIKIRGNEEWKGDV